MELHVESDNRGGRLGVLHLAEDVREFAHVVGVRTGRRERRERRLHHDQPLDQVADRRLVPPQRPTHLTVLGLLGPAADDHDLRAQALDEPALLEDAKSLPHGRTAHARLSGKILLACKAIAVRKVARNDPLAHDRRQLLVDEGGPRLFRDEAGR